MHSNPSFRRVDEAKSVAAARNHGIGTLCVNGPDGPLMSHIPFLLSEDGARVEAHLTRSNPILRAIETPRPALLAVSLGEAYISPDWYGVDDQVPTLNYIAIHLRGALGALPAAELRAHVDRLSAHFEGKLDKLPWTSDKMSDGVMERMMRAIVPVEMRVDNVQSTWKLNQNKASEQRLAAAGQVAHPLIAQAMREAE